MALALNKIDMPLKKETKPNQTQNINSKETENNLNNVELSINFNHEKESNNTIPFLDILIIKSQSDLTFKVYHEQKRLYTFLLQPQQQNQNRPYNWLLSMST